MTRNSWSLGIRRTLACGLGLLASFGALHADELRLRDGRVLVGTVTAQGAMLEVATRDGVVRVPAADVEARRTEADLRRELQGLAARAADTPFAHLQLAAQARAFGLDAELWQHLGAASALPRDPEQPALRRRLDDFLAQLEPDLLPRRFRGARTTVRVHELLAQLPESGPAIGGKRAALLELLRREPDAERDLRSEARRNGNAGRRLLAVETLLLRDAADAAPFAWRTAILDRDADARSGAVAIAQACQRSEGAVAYLAPGLMHASAEVRVRTADAFARLGGPQARDLLVAAGPSAGKALAGADDGVRAHIAILEQRAYIRDFDVEVAQASFIADPKVDVLQSGSVLDVTVHGVFEEQVRIVRAYRRALHAIVGSDPGADPRAWSAWVAQATGARTDAAPTTPRKN